MEKTTFIVVAAAILLLATIVQAEEKKEQVSNESNKGEKSLQAEASSKKEVKDPLELQATNLRNTKETLRASETSDPPHPAPEPYQFSFETKDPKAGEQFRKEDGNKDGVVRGSYGFRTPNGIFRVVDYIADSLGFRAKIRSNEPGISNRHPTGVKVEAEGGGELIGSGRPHPPPPPPPPPPLIDEGERVPVAIKSFGQRVPAPLPPVIEDEKVAIGVKDFDQRVPAPISPLIDEGEKVAISGFGHRVPSPPPQTPVQVTYFNKPPPPSVSGEVLTGVDYEEPYDSPRDFKKPNGFDSEGLPPPPPPPPRSPPSTLVVKDYSPPPPPPPPPSKVYIQEKVPVRDADIPSPPVKSLVHYNVWFNKYAPPLGSFVDQEKYSPPPPSDDYVEEHAAIKVQPPSGDYEEQNKYVPPPPPPPPPPSPSQDYGDGLVIKKPPFKDYDYDQREELPPPPPPPPPPPSTSKSYQEKIVFDKEVPPPKDYLGGVSYVKESLPPQDYDGLSYGKDPEDRAQYPRNYDKDFYGKGYNFYKGPRITVIYHDLYNNMMGFRPYKYPVHDGRDDDYFVLNKAKKYVPFSPPSVKSYQKEIVYEKEAPPPPPPPPPPPTPSKQYHFSYSQGPHSSSDPKDYSGELYNKEPIITPSKDYDDEYSYDKRPLPPVKEYDGAFYDKERLPPPKDYADSYSFDKHPPPPPPPKDYADEHSFIREPPPHGKKFLGRGYDFYKGPRITVIYHDLYDHLMGLRPHKYRHYPPQDPEFVLSKSKKYVPFSPPPPPPPPPAEKSPLPYEDFGPLPESKVIRFKGHRDYGDRPNGDRYQSVNVFGGKPGDDGHRDFYPIRHGGPRLVTFSKCRNGGCGPFPGLRYNGCKGGCGSGLVLGGIRSIDGGAPGRVVIRKPEISPPRPVGLKVIAITTKAVQPEPPTAIIVSKPQPKVTKILPLLLAIKPTGKCALVCGK